MGVENNIPEGWMEKNLESVIELIIDHRGKTPKKLGGDWSTEGYRAVSAKTVKNGRLINEDKMNILPKDLYHKWMKCEIEFGDVLLTSEAPLGEHMIWKSKEKIVLSQRIFGIRTDSEILNPAYFNYFIDSRFFQHELKSRESGSTVTGIKQSELLKTKLIFPPLKEQKAIAKVLTAFDDKIELLQAQNKTLETMAQTIFKEWFGKYQQELTPPNGWRIFSLSELVDVINGYSYKGIDLVEASNEALVTLKSFDRNGGFQTRGFKPFKGSPKTQHEVKIGDLVVAHTDLTQDAEVLGNPAFIFDNGGFEKMYITMDLVKVISKNENIGSSFLYYLMKDKYFKGHCVGYSNGTTVLHLSKKAIPEYKLYLPENFDLIKKFTKIANDTTNKISLNKDAIKSLTKTIDTLLPKLMSGQIRVNNIKQTADA